MEFKKLEISLNGERRAISILPSEYERSRDELQALNEIISGNNLFTKFCDSICYTSNAKFNMITNYDVTIDDYKVIGNLCIKKVFI